MNVKFINPFLEGTISVLKTMAFVEPRAGKPYLKMDSLAKGDISGIIGLTGSATGSLAVSFSEAAILKIVSNMLGENIKSMDGNIKDAVGEITNMISGVARKNLEADGFYIQAAIPTVVSGKNHSIAHVMGGPSLIIPFEIDDGSFVVDVCLAEENSKKK
ncbi:MAG TPA: chemotaxis protein CheX [Smithellaceae bacterium]|jgi:chemotaxis protein CheX|nr:chemotaxis protein CheX [Syntrophaceae bacterium]HOE79736.1 chemotaxis protein CheX [Smithellaceae bacterium]HPL96602.1 chemotaxis protein CheX [Smithellaceae bacterium]HPV49024.1 chemotaxis protein CheX [Smithellaceae bacterium]HQF84267.1 chemotaxis protein CheX [Smithellaceae bacterium]